MLMPIIARQPVGLDRCNSEWHLACRLPGEGAIAMSILNMEMKITLIAYFTNVHESQKCPLPNGLSCRPFVVSCVPVFIYPFWNYLRYSDIFLGLLTLTIRAYFSFGWSMLTSVLFIWLYWRQKGEEFNKKKKKGEKKRPLLRYPLLRKISLCQETIFMSFEYFPGCIRFLIVFLYKITNSGSLFWRRIQGEIKWIPCDVYCDSVKKVTFYLHSFGESAGLAAGISLLCSFSNTNYE